MNIVRGMFESLNYRGLNETALLTVWWTEGRDCGHLIPDRRRCFQGYRKSHMMLGGLHNKTVHFCWLYVDVCSWVVRMNVLLCGIKETPPTALVNRYQTIEFQWHTRFSCTARGTLNQPAKIVKFDLTRRAPPHYSFKRAAAFADFFFVHIIWLHFFLAFPIRFKI